MTLATRSNGETIDAAWFNDIKDEIDNSSLTVTAVTTTYPIVATDKLVTGDATGGAFDVTLPLLSGNTGKNYIVKKIDASANAVTLEGNGSETIDGALNVALSSRYDNVWVVAGASEWHVVAKWNDIQDLSSGSTPTFAGITNDSADINVATTTSGDINLNSVDNVIVASSSGADTSATTQTVKFGDDTGGITGIRNNSGAVEFQNLGGGWNGIAAVGAGGYSQSMILSNIGLSIVMAANAVTIALKQSDGSSDATGGSPTTVGFRHATITTGAYNLRTVTSSLATVISSGSTAGTASATSNKIYIYLLDNSGTLELAWSRLLFRNENELITTVAEGGAGGADSNRIMYSTTQRTDLPFRLIGSFTSTQATAGTWATNASEVFTGNQQAIAGETIKARYDTNAGQTIGTGSWEIVDFEDNDYDPHASVTTGATWKFTAPSSGAYRVKTFIRFADTSLTAGQIFQLAIYKENAGYATVYFHEIETSVTKIMTMGGAADVELNEGEFIDVRAWQNSGGGISLDSTPSNVWVTVIKK